MEEGGGGGVRSALPLCSDDPRHFGHLVSGLSSIIYEVPTNKDISRESCVVQGRDRHCDTNINERLLPRLDAGIVKMVQILISM